MADFRLIAVSNLAKNEMEKKSMKVWMDVMRDVEYLLDDYDPILDAWEAGGVDGLVIGPMVFNARKLVPGTGSRYVECAEPPTATFDPNPTVYRRLGVEPPPPPDNPYPDKRAQLERLLTAAKQRGWTVYIFQAANL